jgi:hypothetical protein
VGCAVIGDMYVRGGAIVEGDGKPVVIDASGSDDKRVRMVSFFTMIMYPLFIYIYLDLTLIHSRCDLRQHSLPIHRPYLNFLPRHQTATSIAALIVTLRIFFEYSS